MTVEAGVSLKELYAAAGARNRTLVAGSSYTVGAAGGFIQGGGHSPIGTWKGMASDNALEFQVVTANVGSNLSVESVANDSRANWCTRTPTKIQIYSGLCEGEGEGHLVWWFASQSGRSLMHRRC